MIAAPYTLHMNLFLTLSILIFKAIECLRFYPPVRLLAPMEVVASGGNASVQWKWERPQYHIQLMVCQVQLNHSGHTDLVSYSRTPTIQWTIELLTGKY